MAEETQGKAPETSAPAAAPQTGGPRIWSSPGRTPRRPRRTRQVFPPQKGLQVLHREDRCDSLPRRAPAAGLRGRARQDCAPPSDRRMHHAPAPPHPRHQAGPQHRPAAVCHQALGSRTRLVNWPSSSRDRLSNVRRHSHDCRCRILRGATNGPLAGLMTWEQDNGLRAGKPRLQLWRSRDGSHSERRRS